MKQQRTQDDMTRAIRGPERRHTRRVSSPEIAPKDDEHLERFRAITKSTAHEGLPRRLQRLLRRGVDVGAVASVLEELREANRRHIRAARWRRLDSKLAREQKIVRRALAKAVKLTRGFYKKHTMPELR